MKPRDAAGGQGPEATPPVGPAAPAPQRAVPTSHADITLIPILPLAGSGTPGW